MTLDSIGDAVASTDFRGSAFNDHFRTFLDDNIALKSLFYLFYLGGADVPGRRRK